MISFLSNGEKAVHLQSALADILVVLLSKLSEPVGIGLAASGSFDGLRSAGCLQHPFDFLCQSLQYSHFFFKGSLQLVEINRL